MRSRKKHDYSLQWKAEKVVSHPDLSTKLSVIATVHEVGMGHDKINIRDPKHMVVDVVSHLQATVGHQPVQSCF